MAQGLQVFDAGELLDTILLIIIFLLHFDFDIYTSF